VLSEFLGVLGPYELLVLRSADVDEGTDGRGAVGWLEGLVVDGVPVDLTNVQVLLDLGDLFGDDAVCNAPDLVRRRVVMVRQLLPEGALDERDDTARSFWSPSVILTNGGMLVGLCPIRHTVLEQLATSSPCLDKGVSQSTRRGAEGEHACQKRRT
jgi:hypothetical protein